MFMGNSSNNNNGVNVNNNLFTSYSDTAAVVLGAWNQQLSLRIKPFKGVNADGIRQYAQDNSEIISTSLTLENATALIKAINEELDTGKTDSVSVPIGGPENRKMLSILKEGDDIFLRLAINVDENGKTADSNIIKHKFNKKEVMLNYNPATGEGTKVTINAEYEAFKEKLKDVNKLSSAIAHSIAYNNALKASFSNRNAANNNSMNPPYQAPTNTFNADSMGDFLPFS